MNKQILAGLWKEAPKLLRQHSPGLLTGAGIVGMVITTVAAVRATPKAMQIVDEKEIQDGKRLTKTEIVKSTWKCYIPAAITGACSIACLIGANSVNAKRNAAIATAYAMSVADLKEYRKKAAEVVGEKKEQAICDEIAKDKLEQAHVEDRQIIITGKGETPCYDPLTDRYFKSDIETLRRAENTLNKQMRDDVYITLNEFFTEIGLEECQLGEQLGWDIEKGYIDLAFTSHLNKNGVPCLVLGHHNPPQYIMTR